VKTILDVLFESKCNIAVFQKINRAESSKSVVAETELVRHVGS
jgi:hypothetical protein